MSRSYDADAVVEDDLLLVAVRGELDLTARPAFAEHVAALVHAHAPRRVAIDLHEVTFCDSSGLGALLDIRREADATGYALVLRDVSSPVARLLDLADVDGWLERE